MKISIYIYVRHPILQHLDHSYPTVFSQLHLGIQFTNFNVLFLDTPDTKKEYLHKDAITLSRSSI